MSVILVSIAILFMLFVERLTITKLTRKGSASCKWISKCRFLHPNAISVFRIPQGLVSVYLWCNVNYIFAMLWFAFWMISDLTDGTIARNCNLLTQKGKWLDPFSDKCLYLPLLVMFAYQGIFSWNLAIIFIVIEVIGQSSRLFSKKTAANSFGKAKTAMFTFLLIIVALSRIANTPYGASIVSERLVYMLLFSCCILAFLSFYCKVIPDEWYANSLTCLNFICGIASIYSAYNNHIMQSLVLIFTGQFFDLLDGRAARKFGSTKYGALFDDIADGTSFGLAVGVILFRIVYPESGVIGLVVSLIYVLSVLYRLRRFMKDSGKVPDGLFSGLPAPAGAMLAGSSAVLFSNMPMLVNLFSIFASILMVSHIFYKHFGQTIWPKLPNMLKLVTFLFVLIFINFSISRNNIEYFKWMCFVIIMLYVLFPLHWKNFIKLKKGADNGI